MVVVYENIIKDLKCCGNCGESNGIYDCRMKPIEFYRCEHWIAHKNIYEKYTKEIIEKIEKLEDKKLYNG